MQLGCIRPLHINVSLLVGMRENTRGTLHGMLLEVRWDTYGSVKTASWPACAVPMAASVSRAPRTLRGLTIVDAIWGFSGGLLGIFWGCGAAGANAISRVPSRLNLRGPRGDDIPLSLRVHTHTLKGTALLPDCIEPRLRRSPPSGISRSATPCLVCP